MFDNLLQRQNRQSVAAPLKRFSAFTNGLHDYGVTTRDGPAELLTFALLKIRRKPDRNNTVNKSQETSAARTVDRYTPCSLATNQSKQHGRLQQQKLGSFLWDSCRVLLEDGVLSTLYHYPSTFQIPHTPLEGLFIPPQLDIHHQILSPVSVMQSCKDWSSMLGGETVRPS